MVFDLGLNRSVGDSDAPEMLGNSSKAFFTESNGTSMARSMEERRTLLSTYFLTSLWGFPWLSLHLTDDNRISWSIKRMEGLQYSPYLEHCRLSLLEFAEYESDIILAALVKLQSIIEKTNRNILEKDYPGGERVPVWMHSKLAVLELQSYWATLSPGVRENSEYCCNLNTPKEVITSFIYRNSRYELSKCRNCSPRAVFIKTTFPKGPR